MELIEGNIYWTTKPSMESENYNDYEPRQPWKGKLNIRKSLHGSDNLLYLHRFSEEYGVDTDSNATAFCGTSDKPEDLFETESVANDSFITKFTDYLQEKTSELNDLRIKFDNWMKK